MLGDERFHVTNRFAHGKETVALTMCASGENPATMLRHGLPAFGSTDRFDHLPPFYLHFRLPPPPIAE